MLILIIIAAVRDTVYEQLVALATPSGAASLSEDELKALSKRKLVAKKVVTYFKMFKGPQFKPKFAKLKADLTAEMLASGGSSATSKPESSSVRPSSTHGFRITDDRL